MTEINAVVWIAVLREDEWDTAGGDSGGGGRTLYDIRELIQVLVANKLRMLTKLDLSACLSIT